MKRIGFVLCGCLLVAGSAWVFAQESLPDGGGNAVGQAGGARQYSYAIGLDLGTSFRSSETALDLQSLMAGVQDGLGGGEPKYDRQTCQAALEQLQMEMRSKQLARQQVAGAENRKLGTAFLSKNRQQPAVRVTDSGLQYKVIKAADGPKPQLSDTVRCHYRGTLIDGTEFDASARHGGPAEFPVRGVIPGWTEALQLMSVGEKWELFIPADLAYGDSPPGPPIEAGSTLVFEIELLGIMGR